MKTNPIQDFILKSEHNLRIAATVNEMWPEVREKIVSGFLDRLTSRLRKKLKGWDFENWGRCFIEPVPCFYFWKPAWKAQHSEPQYYVSLQFEDYGRKMTFGLARNYGLKHIKKRAHCPELLTAVGKLQPSASAKTWWEAKVNMRSPAADWTTPQALWRMQKDGKFLEEVAEQLVQVAQTCTPIIDRLVREKWKGKSAF